MSTPSNASARELALKGSTPAPQFPFLDLKAQFASIRQEVMSAIERVMDSQHFILGPEVSRFETEAAKYVGTKFAVSCASGSDALLLAMMALGIDEGDEVITTPFTFGATAGCIARLKARPVFVDIDPHTFNLDPQQIEAAITPRTRVIMPVHLFGLSADMDPIMDIARRHDLWVIEDAAQAIGSRYHGTAIGAIGTLGCFSFFPSKNLGGAGDGGMVTTNDAELAERLKMLRQHGCRNKYVYDTVGMNSRLDAIQAAILSVKLPHLNDWASARARNAERYRILFSEAGLEGRITLPVTPHGRVHVFNQYTIRVSERDQLRAYLQRAGIATEIYYPHPLHTENAYGYLGYSKGDFPQAEAAALESLSLPIFAELTEDQQKAVVRAIADFFVTKKVQAAS